VGNSFINFLILQHEFNNYSTLSRIVSLGKISRCGQTADVDTLTILFPKLPFSILVSLMAAFMMEFSFYNLAFAFLELISTEG